MRAIKKLDGLRNLPNRIRLKGKTVFFNTDLNVTVQNKELKNDIALRMALPSLNFLTDRGAKVVLCNKQENDLDLISTRLQLLSASKVIQTSIDSATFSKIEAMENGDIVIVNADKDGKRNSEILSQQITNMIKPDCYVDDDYKNAYQNTSPLSAHNIKVPKVMGVVIEKELESVSEIDFTHPEQNVAVIGGDNDSLLEQLTLVEDMIDHCKFVLLAGETSLAYLTATKGVTSESILVSKTIQDCINRIQAKVDKERKCELILPIDFVQKHEVNNNNNNDKPTYNVIKSAEIQNNPMNLIDIGPESEKRLISISSTPTIKHIFWSGRISLKADIPHSTNDYANALVKLTKERGKISIVCASDCLMPLRINGLANEFSYFSNGSITTSRLLIKEKTSLDSIDEKIEFE